MQCSQILNLLDDYLDGTTNQAQRAEFARHLAECATCRQQVLFAQQLQQQLVTLPHPQPSKDFEAKVLPGHRKTDFQRKSGFIAGFSTAIAASLALWFVLAPPNAKDPTIASPVAQIELAVDQTQQVSLMFNSPLDIENATMRLELPRNVELVGYRQRSQLEWQMSLRKGTNRLVLPLIAHGAPDKPLQATIFSNGNTRTFAVKVKTRRSPAAVKQKDGIRYI